jgi:5-methylcytosine-specific restriction endonuclease McrA
LPYKDPQKQRQAQRNAYLKKMGLGPEFVFELPAKRAAERLKALETEIAWKYANNQSALSVGREYGISKNTVLRIAADSGIPLRGKEEAGILCRQIDTTLTPEELADDRPIAQQLAERLGYGTSKGLSYNREFQTACTKEYRRRFAARYREIDRKRKKFLNRIPAWQSRAEIVAFLDMAHDLALEVDHIIPLQGKYVSGLNVMSNLRLLHRKKNQSKQNKCDLVPDYLIGHPSIHDPRVRARVQNSEQPMLLDVLEGLT